MSALILMSSPGEHILSFAACAGNEDIISMVIDAGASTRVQDYRGTEKTEENTFVKLPLSMKEMVSK